MNNRVTGNLKSIISLHTGWMILIDQRNHCIVSYFYSASDSMSLTFCGQKRSWPQQLTLCWSLHAEASQAAASEGLAQGPYVAARAGFEPTTLWSKGIDSTNAPPLPTYLFNCTAFSSSSSSLSSLSTSPCLQNISNVTQKNCMVQKLFLHSSLQVNIWLPSSDFDVMFSSNSLLNIDKRLEIR